MKIQYTGDIPIAKEFTIPPDRDARGNITKAGAVKEYRFNPSADGSPVVREVQDDHGAHLIKAEPDLFKEFITPGPDAESKTRKDK